MKIVSFASLVIVVIVFMAFISQNDAKKKSMERGKKSYEQLCIVCHQPEGKGLPGVFPPLAGSDFLKNKVEKSIHAVKYGLTGEIVVNGETYNSVMTPQQLSDEDVADVLNYVMNSWGNEHELITFEQVKGVSE